jgi:hypothetical protein
VSQARQRNVSPDKIATWQKKALDLLDPTKTKIVLPTRKGRLFVIPHDTTVKDALKGVVYPRSQVGGGPFPFEDLQTRPRIRRHEPDSAGFNTGSHVDLYFVPNERVEA